MKAASLVVAIGSVAVGGCALTPDNPFDPARCNSACAAGQTCYKGRCIAPDAGPPADTTHSDEVGPTSDITVDFGLADKGIADTAHDSLRPDATTDQGFTPDATIDQGLTPDTTIDHGLPDVATCGNNALDPGEDCDGVLLNDKSCMSLGFEGGNLGCTACALDPSGCYKCGDKKKNGAEQCDGQDLGAQSCQTLGMYGGTLACFPTCTYEISMCLRCGDGIVNGTEQCDGFDLNGKQCTDIAFAGGTLSCTPGSCTFDTAGCFKCGDATCNTTEDCNSCAADCGSCCGNGTCETQYGETSTSCAADCKVGVESSDCVVTLQGSDYRLDVPDATPPPGGVANTMVQYAACTFTVTNPMAVVAAGFDSVPVGYNNEVLCGLFLFGGSYGAAMTTWSYGGPPSFCFDNVYGSSTKSCTNLNLSLAAGVQYTVVMAGEGIGTGREDNTSNTFVLIR